MAELARGCSTGVQLADLDLGPARWGAVAVLSPVPYRFELREHRW